LLFTFAIKYSFAKSKKIFIHQAIGGLYSEFIAGARLDNLVGTYTAVQGLLESLEGPDGGLDKEPNIRIAMCFDNEEVGVA
jgi:aspartyl aminopeptidase